MINLLKQYFNKADLSLYGKDLPRAGGTELITAKLEKFAIEQKYEFKREVFLGLIRKSNGYKGLIDVILTTSDGIRYAIEIDSSNKKWSLEKLLHAHNIGYIPIWIRWCTKIKIEIPSVINLINLNI